MRVLLLTRCLELGGAERQLTLLARGLAERGHQAEVTVFYGGGPLAGELEAARVPLFELGKAGRWDLAGPALRLRRILRQRRPQVLYSFLDTPNLLAAWLRPLCPGLKVVWGARASDMDLTRYDWFSGLANRLLKASARGAHLIIVNSRSGAELLKRRGWPAARLKVIANGIDTRRFRPDPPAGAAVRAQWGVAQGAPLAGMVARLDPMKDHHTFLRAAALMQAKRPDLRLVCVGPGPDDLLAELKGLAGRLGLGRALVWAGPRQDMPAVMDALDLCLLTSAFGEGFPNVLGEAMACGTPCVATEVGDTPWVVGDPALIARPGDAAGLAAAGLAVLGLGQAQREALGRSARRRVEENFSLQAMVRASEEALAELIGEG